MVALTTFKKMIITFGYVNSGGDGCDFGHDNGSGEKE